MVGWASVAVSNCFLVRENHRASHAAEVLFLKQAVQVAKYGREGLEPKTNVQGKEAKRWGFFCWRPVDKVWKYLMAYTPVNSWKMKMN